MRKNKTNLTLESLALTLCASMVIVVVLALTEIIFGWGVIWGCLTLLLHPVARKIIEVWHENRCRDLDDLWRALQAEQEEPGDLQTISEYPYY
jgi:hypothetical protein